MKKTSKMTNKRTVTAAEFRPYRVLFLVVVISVTCLVVLATLAVSYEV